MQRCRSVSVEKFRIDPPTASLRATRNEAPKRRSGDVALRLAAALTPRCDDYCNPLSLSAIARLTSPISGQLITAI